MCRYCRTLDEKKEREPLRKIVFLNGTFIIMRMDFSGYGHEMLIAEYGKGKDHHKIAVPIEYCPVCGRPLRCTKREQKKGIERYGKKRGSTRNDVSNTV